MQTFEYSDEEAYQDSIKEKLDKLHDLPLKFKHKTVCLRSISGTSSRKSQTCFKINKRREESSSESSCDDSSEIQLSEFDISDENKKSNILCQYKNSFFNEKIKMFNEIKSKKFWQGKQISRIQINKDDQSIKLNKSPSIQRQSSPISESNHNTLSFIKRTKEVGDHSFDQSFKQVNSPLMFLLTNVHQTSINNNSSSNFVNNRSCQQSLNNSQFTIDVPCNDSFAQQPSIKLNEKDLLNQIIEAVFNRNIQLLTKIVLLLQKEYRTDILNMKDINGNTPLLLAVKLQQQQNQFSTIRLLLSNGSDPSIKDTDGWSPIEETVAQNDLLTTSLLFDYLVSKKLFDMQSERNQIDQELLKINDFYLEMKWEFKSSFIPFISKFTPNDTYKIYKRGSSLRLDSTFAGTKNYKTKRRDLTVIYNPLMGSVQKKENSSNCKFVTILNRAKKIYYYPIQEIDPEEKNQILKDLVNCESVSGDMKVIGCELIKSKNFFGNYVSQKIHNWICQKYEFRIQTSQHFNKKHQQHYYMSLDQYLNQSMDQNPTSARFNLEQITSQIVGDQLFVNSPSFKQENEQIKKKIQGNIKNENQKKSSESCQLYISQAFPLNFQQFLPIIKMLSNGNEFMQSLKTVLSNESVKQLLNDKGFPIRIEIPINFTIDAVVTFQAYKQLDMEDNQIKSLFQIPEEYQLVSRRDATKVMRRGKKRLLLANLFL
ncbi:unnamed protein product (macronuclear) [Paramecium tetraurelia]|uniref:Ankyrin repeat domain-containing protein n=1 Tax=Paramecium tetraurelia TaxID=5888 RepID=A0BSB9_PARTE|nr:uncharacterized protein GSPATT00031667001 [Paramecium tetraurelia]CAK61436.1 unnamed protein product [Paramecium tetraurelia]|eukprot:XP_001428834.1 hypothetical protein (macronuclear) [Paramecium tetraurelia strain d4-2]